MDDIKLFDDFSMSNLLKEIYSNSKKRGKELDKTLKGLDGVVQSINDAVVVLPVVKEFFDVMVKNDDQLIKMAAIVQRMHSRASSISNGDFNLTEEEKEHLLQELSLETQKELTELKMLQKGDDDLLKEFTGIDKELQDGLFSIGGSDRDL
jgi:cysteinyl-tRNA synthetase